jgi:hypothetical protein
MRNTDSKITSLIRWRAGLAVAALVIPLALFFLSDRQARRLDALATHGKPVDAQVTAVSRDNGITFYAYRVGGNEYTWNVARAEAPFAVGQVFPATYLPEDPSFSRPSVDPDLAARKAARTRNLAWKTCLGAAALLLLFCGLVHRELRRLRTRATSERTDPKAYKQRLRFTALALLPIFLMIGGFHFQDALERGESVVPVIMGLAVCAGIVGGVFYFVGRNGPRKARERSMKVLRWVVPLAIGIALLRLIALIIMK